MHKSKAGMNRRSFVCGLAGTAAASSVRAELAWPAQQVTFLVPYPPGGYIDVVTRIVAEGLRQQTGQTTVVMNRTGGNGQVALGDLSRAAPDGYTLLTNNDGGIGLPPAVDRNFRYVPVRDYSAIAQVVEADYVLTARGGLPVRTVSELIAYAKASPRPLTYASPGIGSTPHIGMEFFLRRVGLEATHVPYTGSAPAINDLIAGQVDLYLASLPTMIGYVGTDRVHILASFNKTRAPETPDVPTIQEAGIDQFVLPGWLGLFGPPGLPEDLKAAISRTIAAVVHDPDVTKKLRATSADPVTRDSVDFAKFYLAEVDRWRAFSRETGIHAGD